MDNSDDESSRAKDYRFAYGKNKSRKSEEVSLESVCMVGLLGPKVAL
jgi:hypothetical protein